MRRTQFLWGSNLPALNRDVGVAQRAGAAHIPGSVSIQESSGLWVRKGAWQGWKIHKAAQAAVGRKSSWHKRGRRIPRNFRL